MADLNYKVGIDTNSAARSLTSLQNSIVGFGAAVAGAFAFKELSGVSSRFQDLRTSLSLLYKSAQLGGAAFEDIKKFAASSVFSVEDLTNTVIKLKASGLEPTVAMLRLFADTSSVAADSIGALQAITDLYARTTAGGLGLEDLNRLADRGIPVFTILSERLGLSRLEISKLGQTAEGAALILKALEQGLNDAFGGASAARANNVSQAMSNLGDSFDNAADSVGQAGLNQGLADLYKSLGQLLDAATPLFKVIGQLLGGALRILADNIKLATAAAALLITTFAVSRIAAIGGAVLGLAKTFNILNIVVGKNPIVRIIGLALGAAAAIGILTTETDDLSDSLNEAGNGFQSLSEGAIGGTAEDLRALAAEFDKTKATMRLFADELTSGYSQSNYEIENGLRLQQEVLNLSEKEAAIKTAMFNAQESYLKKREELTKKIAEIEATGTAEEKAQIDELRISYKALSIGYEYHKKAVEELTGAVANDTRTRQAHLFSIQEEIRSSNDLIRIQDDIARLTMTEIEQKYYDIEAAAKASAKAAIEAEEARRNESMPIAEQQKYYDMAIARTQRLKRAQGELFEQSRKFSTGWKKAMNDYVANVANAANQAAVLFNRAMMGMEDAIVNFAKTGKFEWKNFVSMMLEELLRAQIQQVFAGMMGNMQGTMRNTQQSMLGGQGSGGLSNILGSLGGLFSGLMPGESGGVPNNVSLGGIGNVLGSIGSGISSVVGSIGSTIGKLFGGFFANGGTLGAGKFGIVGERGPELISGPATITPLGMGGATYVTYNINAVDAASFQTLVARDPSFIYAVSEQGRRSINGTRR